MCPLCLKLLAAACWCQSAMVLVSTMRPRHLTVLLHHPHNLPNQHWLHFTLQHIYFPFLQFTLNIWFHCVFLCVTVSNVYLQSSILYLRPTQDHLESWFSKEADPADWLPSKIKWVYWPSYLLTKFHRLRWEGQCTCTCLSFHIGKRLESLPLQIK